MREQEQATWKRAEAIEVADIMKRGEGYVRESEADVNVRLYGRRDPYGSTFIDGTKSI